MIDYELAHGDKSVFHLPGYDPSTKIQEILRMGNIISEKETPQDLLTRVINTLFLVENQFGTYLKDTKKMAEEFAEYMVEGYVMLGTPTLTNAGRYNTALSSCVIIPGDFHERTQETEERICSYYRQNMGSGFELQSYNDPVAMLTWINELSARETLTGNYNRYIGNIGILPISHPYIKEFIEIKRHKDMKHFNISIDVTEEFMRKAEEHMPFMLANGTTVEASVLLDLMAENAWHNGEPGLIFLERMNKDNPVASISRYIGTPPCAEMGLAEGETCHFGYINVSNFVRDRGNRVNIDFDKLKRVTELLTRVLDNAIEYSIPRYPTSVSMDISRMNRRIGIGVCGLADTFIAHELPYDSQEARNLAKEVLSFINYVSKCTSVVLAEQRGSCLAMNFPTANMYMSGHFIEDKYARHATRLVSSHDWELLANTIRKTGKLRNISTTTLPPTGRASILLDVAPSIEPMFSIFANDGYIYKSIKKFLNKKLHENWPLLEKVYQEATMSGSFQDIGILPASIRACLKTAKELEPLAHIQMVADTAGLQGVIDESASKTVNLPHEATVKDVRNILLTAFHLGLKNIALYRDQTRKDQPMHL